MTTISKLLFYHADGKSRSGDGNDGILGPVENLFRDHWDFVVHVIGKARGFDISDVSFIRLAQHALGQNIGKEAVVFIIYHPAGLTIFKPVVDLIRENYRRVVTAPLSELTPVEMAWADYELHRRVHLALESLLASITDTLMNLTEGTTSFC